MKQEEIFKGLKRWQIIEIVWEDSSHSSGWKNSDDFDDEKFREHKTIGYLLNTHKNTIQVVQSYGLDKRSDGTQNVDAMMQIPKKCILSIKKLKL